ncbi:MAG: OmpA family protein [Candidatus Zixiibacteriota bacterium]|nr:MAG: OmpA family protein [candidate division Zixibacteria bacterium]
MAHRYWIISLLVLLLALQFEADAQFKDIGTELGLAVGSPVGVNENEYAEQDPQAMVRFLAAWPLFDRLQLEVGGGYARNGRQHGPYPYDTQMNPLDMRLRFAPLGTFTWFPYLYGGAGALYYHVNEGPAGTELGDEHVGWTGYLPFGGGIQYRMNDDLSLDLCGGYNYTFTDRLNPREDDENDHFMSLTLGLRYGIWGGTSDWDRDRLIRREERQLGTNPRKADTDEDGVQDGDEVQTHHTDPLRPDTDGDGLKDGEELLTYKTDPLKPDTDGDGLSDADEIRKHDTNPLVADTDGDGLMDGEELLTYKTDPLKPDTDTEGLNDKQEVADFKTSPLEADTDQGGVNDFVEVNRNSDPLDPADDLPRVQDQKITLSGINFRLNSAEILPEMVPILEAAVTALRDNPAVRVEVCGHTDITGPLAYNMQLSERRAQSVRNWLREHGIAAERILTRGCGPEHPVADNETPEGRYKNRRADFTQVE